MELWSNEILSDFAIKFDSQMVVKTSDNAALDGNIKKVLTLSVPYDI
jgi:hypothetical protein